MFPFLNQSMLNFYENERRIDEILNSIGRMNMEILIAGDFVPTKSNRDKIELGDVSAIMSQDILTHWYSADFRIFNLEVPLTDIETPIPKMGQNFIASTKTVRGLKQLKPSVVTLANNHIMDQGIQGLESTMKVLLENEIPYVGAGRNLREASTPYIISYNDLKIGIYTCAEHEFSIASDFSPGANPFDPLESLDHISMLKEKCNYVVVLYHGGKEHYRYPSPKLQKICRKIVEKGADLVVCQHSHCIGCYENYYDKVIIYGQGNFIFSKSWHECWDTSLIVQLNIEKNRFDVEFIPIIRTHLGIRKAIGKEAEEILDGFQNRSDQIKDEKFVQQKYKDFAMSQRNNYLRAFAGYGKWTSRIDHKLFGGKLINMKYNKKKLLALQNYIECEAHAELVLAAIKGDTD